MCTNKEAKQNMLLFKFGTALNVTSHFHMLAPKDGCRCAQLIIGIVWLSIHCKGVCI